MSLKVKFKTEVIVPRWENCNEQKDQVSKNDNFCEFMTGCRDERCCKLFNSTLYSSYGWVKKCNKCVDLSINNDESIELL